jgi:hypothetical protein
MLRGGGKGRRSERCMISAKVRSKRELRASRQAVGKRANLDVVPDEQVGVGR